MALERKRIRLEGARYRGRGLFFLTFCTAERYPIFASANPAEWLLRRLHELAAQHFFQLHAWCLMPDHLHVLLAGTLDTCDMITFVTRFKQATGFEGKRLLGKPIWQAHFYDHIVRRGESGHSVAAYIWWNPVRKGLCTDPRAFPYSGSDTADWKRSFLAVPDWTPPWKAQLGTRKP